MILDLDRKRSGDRLQPPRHAGVVEADPAPTTRRLATLHYSEAAIIGWFQTFALLADSGELPHPVRRRPVPRGCRSQPVAGVSSEIPRPRCSMW